MDAFPLLRLLPVVALTWLAFFFGRTLLPGNVPLIERIARVGDPQMPEPLRRYTRRLTVVWAAYFVVAAVIVAVAGGAPLATGAGIWSGTFILFVGEHRLRHRLFPDRQFPGLLQQVHDTWAAWHQPKQARG